MKELTPDQLRLARQSPGGFASVVMPEFEYTREMMFLDFLLVQAVLAAANPTIPSIYRRQIWAIPPRLGKSLLASQFGVAWSTMIIPTAFRVILITYEADLAAKFGRASRNLVEEYGEKIFGRRLDDSSSAVDNWSLVDPLTKKRLPNGLMAIGLGGTILGSGGQLILCDDISRPNESAAVRRDAFDYFQTVVRSRTEKGTSIIVLGQRVAEDDVIGQLLLNDGVRLPDGNGGVRGRGIWLPTILPWKAEPIGPAHLSSSYDGPLLPDVLGRADGEVLWPGRLSDEEIREREMMPTHIANAILSQRPTFDSERQAFSKDDFRYFDTLGFGDNATYRLRLADGRTELIEARQCSAKFFTMDLASSQKKKRADLTAIAVWTKTPNGRLLLLDLVTGYMTGPEQETTLTTMAEHYQPNAIWVDAEGYQTTLIDRMRPTLPNVSALPARRGGVNKVSAADYAATVMRGEGILWPTPARARWVRPLEDQLLRFPTQLGVPGTDDMVDVVSYGAQVGAGKGLGLSDNALRVITSGERFNPDARVGERSSRGGWIRVSNG